MKTRWIVAVAASAVMVAGTPVALANYDDWDDANRCDKSAARGGWNKQAGPVDPRFDVAEGYELWAPGGHYVLRNSSNRNYVEVVGGQSYHGSNHAGGNQGGYVQGSYRVNNSTKVDFHANAFAGGNSPNHSEFVCVGGEGAGQDRAVQTPGGSQPDKPDCDDHPQIPNGTGSGKELPNDIPDHRDCNYPTRSSCWPNYPNGTKPAACTPAPPA